MHTLPAVSALRRGFPGARIDWLVERRHRDVLLGNPDVDEILEVDTLGWRKALHRPATWREIAAGLRHLRARRYDVVLDLQGTVKSAVSAFLARADRRVGFAREHLRERAAALFYSETVVPNGASAHVIDRHLQLLKALDVDLGERRFPIEIEETQRREASRHLEALGLASYVLINPGGTWSTKRWSPQRFAALAADIRSRFGLQSLVLWGPGEESLAHAIVTAAGGAARLAPPTTVRGMIPYIREARLLVSGDTGPMHLASALGVPVVGIFGPTDPARNGPFGAGDEVVYEGVPCAPCYKKRCPGYDNVCMTSIEVVDVIEAVERRLGA